eukprot:TRINITY_DN254_c0_g1_i2.p1 TRINITY_DN254_c0_g1~~TRINITY_DN254_c0_g1_i2.p1  ORF type:complete len:444 (+),score=80.43 TRINITY_DN254_c0_g1_i2:55-1332(+)
MALLNANTTTFVSAARDQHEQTAEKLARRRQHSDTGSLDDADPTDPVAVNQDADEVKLGVPDEFQIYTSQQQGQPHEFPIYTMEEKCGPNEIPIYTLLQQGVPEEFLIFTLLKRQPQEFPIYPPCETAVSRDAPADGHLQVSALDPHGPPAVTFGSSMKTCHDGSQRPAHPLNQQDGPDEFPIYTVHKAELSCEIPVGGHLQVPASDDVHDPPAVKNGSITKTCQDGCNVHQPAQLLKQHETPEEFQIHTPHETAVSCDTPAAGHRQVSTLESLHEEHFFDTPVESHLQVLASNDAHGAPRATGNAGMKTCPIIRHVSQPASVKPQDSSMRSEDNGRANRGFKVKLHIYDVSRNPAISGLNNILANKHAPVKLGGIFHAAIEIRGNEWSFGSQSVHPEVDTGVKQCAPKKDRLVAALLLLTCQPS